MFTCEKAKTGSLGDALTLTTHRLRHLVVMLETILKFQLPTMPTFSDLREIKHFSCALIEGGAHPWRSELEGITPTKFHTIAATLFLFRKVIPSITAPGDEERAVQAAVQRLSEPAPPVDPDLLSFIGNQVPLLFPKGWDSGYRGDVDNLTLSTSATIDRRGRDGGARGTLKPETGPDDRHRWMSECTGDVGFDPPLSRVCKVASIKEAGKIRVVTINDVQQHRIRPLHNTLYSHISRFPWLLRGDAHPSRFKEFSSHCKGEVFVSGDYEAATDNIPLELYQHLLREVRKTSTYVPSCIWDEAEAYTQCTLDDGGKLYEQRRGQLMGSFLSFPFLCLTNYLIFKFLVRRDVPVRINGDDIVFRSTVEEAERWMDGVSKCGLVLSKGKTLVNGRFFSLNSAFFRASGNKVVEIPYIRSKAYFLRCSSLDALGGKYHSFCKGVGGTYRAKLRAFFLRNHRRVIEDSRRSCTRGLGLRASETTLRLAGMWEREKFYLSLDNEKPLPTAPSDIQWDSCPQGWRRERVDRIASDRLTRAREVQSTHRKEMIAKCWSPTYVRTDNAKRVYWSRVKESTYVYSRELDVTRGKGRDLYRKWFKSSAGLCGLFNCKIRLTNPQMVLSRNPAYLWIPMKEREEEVYGPFL